LTPGAQVAAAIDILTVIDTGNRPADDATADYFRRRRYIGAKDRAHIAGHVYAVLRHRAALEWWIGKYRVDVGPRSRVLAGLVLIEGWRVEAIAACCDGDRFRPAPLGEAEQGLMRHLASRTLRHPEMPRAVANDMPEWLEPYLERVFGQGLEEEMAALNAPAPTDLRVNLLKADRATARRALGAEGVRAEPTPVSPIGLRLRERVPLGNLAAFKAGLVEVQDESSQIAALLADAQPGMRVVDFCAGAGGKTLALAAGMANRGKLVACEVSQRRLERSARRLRRAGVSNVERRALTGERDNGSSAMPAASTGCLSTYRVSAPALGGAIPTPNGARGPKISPSSSNASSKSCAVPPAWCDPAGASFMPPARYCVRKTKRRPKPFSRPSRIFRCCRWRAPGARRSAARRPAARAICG
jgi:16S rRNA (cytosine967-C5)-methyltransferase